jgi:hypothetical protein
LPPVAGYIKLCEYGVGSNHAGQDLSRLYREKPVVRKDKRRQRPHIGDGIGKGNNSFRLCSFRCFFLLAAICVLVSEFGIAGMFLSPTISQCELPKVIVGQI